MKKPAAAGPGGRNCLTLPELCGATRHHVKNKKGTRCFRSVAGCRRRVRRRPVLGRFLGPDRAQRRGDQPGRYGDDAQRHEQHQHGEDPADGGHGGDVAVADRGQRHRGPPHRVEDRGEGVRDRLEMRWRESAGGGVENRRAADVRVREHRKRRNRRQTAAPVAFADGLAGWASCSNWSMTRAQT
jgi:hypothetical protein